MDVLRDARDRICPHGLIRLATEKLLHAFCYLFGKAGLAGGLEQGKVIKLVVLSSMIA